MEKKKHRTVGIEKYFEALYGKTEGLVEVRLIHPTTGAVSRSFFSAIPEAISHCLQHCQSFNIYVGIATRRDDSNGTKGNLCQVPALWVDLDFGSFPGGGEEARSTLNTFPLSPSMIIHTGGGLHVYWLLEQPVDAALQVEGYLRGLAASLKADSTWDLTRILRPPDTFNHPNAKKRAAGRERTEVKLESLNGERFSLTDFDDYWQESPKKTSPVSLDSIPSELPEKFLKLLGTNDRIRATWEGDRPELNDQTRSGYCMAMAHLLVRERFTDEEIAVVLLEMRPDSGKDSIALTIAKARGSDDQKLQGSASATTIQLEVEDIVGFVHRDIEHPDPLIEGGLLPKASVAVVGGISKLGKSIFVMNMGLSLASGQPFLGLFPVPQPRKVLYVQQEISEASMQDRARKMIGNMNHPPPEGNFLLTNCKGLRLDDRKGIEALAEVLHQHKPDVVILDPLYKFHRGDENTVKDMVNFFTNIDGLISQFGATFVISHHHGKPSEIKKTGGQLLRGSSVIFDYGDSYYTLKRKSIKGDRKHVELSFELRNADDPEPLTLYRNPETLWFEVVGDDSRRKVSEFTVLQVLNSFEGPVDQKTLIQSIRERTGAGERSARQGIYDTRDKGLLIEHSGKPKSYSVPDPATGNRQTGILPTSEDCQLQDVE